MAPRFKVLLVGQSGVGKSSLFLRVRDGTFYEHLDFSTLNTDNCTRYVNARNTQTQIVLWDTAGAERFRTLTRNFYHGAHAVLLVFSLNEMRSLSELSSWDRDVMEYAPDALKFLVGSKADLPHKIPQGTMEAFATSHNCVLVLVTSAKTGDGVDEIIPTVADRLLESYSTRQFQMRNSWLADSIYENRGDERPQSDKKTCC